MTPPVWHLFAVAPTTVLVVAALTALAGRLGTRRPTAEVLQAEPARRFGAEVAHMCGRYVARWTTCHCDR